MVVNVPKNTKTYKKNKNMQTNTIKHCILAAVLICTLFLYGVPIYPVNYGEVLLNESHLLVQFLAWYRVNFVRDANTFIRKNLPTLFGGKYSCG